MFKKQDISEDHGSPSFRSDSTDQGSLNTGSNKRSAPAAGSAGQASIGPSIRISGDISGNENLVVHGQVSGSISLPDNALSIGKQGTVDADVSAKMVEVEGKVSGTVQAADLVRVKPSGHVKGDIAAPRVVLEDGCQFRGGIDMQEQKLAGASQPKAKAKANGQDHQPKKPVDSNSEKQPLQNQLNINS